MWWYLDSDSQKHSVSEEELKQLLQTQKIDRQTLVWCEGMKDWQSIEDTEQLAPLLAAVPPPVPRKTEPPPPETPRNPWKAAPLPPAAAPSVEKPFHYAGCWRRYLARFFDLLWEMLLIGLGLVFILGLVMPKMLYALIKINDLWISTILLPVALVIDSLCYAVFRNTPGKYLAGITVTDLNGNPLTAGRYFGRNFRVWVAGLGFGLPIIQTIVALWQAWRVYKTSHTGYDLEAGIEVRVYEGSFHIVVIIFSVILLAFTAAGVMSLVLF